MIIGISGKKQHGKDTVAKIIQWLTQDLSDRPDIDKIQLARQFATTNTSIGTRETWKVKQFASKLKQIVSLLIGCTLEQLEDNKFKETPLGEEWRVWYCYNYGFKNSTNPMGRLGRLFITQDEAIKERSDYYIQHFLDIEIGTHILTPRMMLQYIGTEGGRNIIHPNIWVNALMADYKPLYDNYIYQELTTGKIIYSTVPTFTGNPGYKHLTTKQLHPKWIITDVRFPNEVKAIEDRGGIVLRITNPRVISLDTHQSEISLDNHNFLHYIQNEGNIEQLVERVNTFLKLYTYDSKEGGNKST